MFALVDEGPAGAFDIHSNLSKRSSFVYFMVSLLFTSGLFLSRDVFLVPSIIHHLCKKYPLRVQFKLTTALTTAAGSLICSSQQKLDTEFQKLISGNEMLCRCSATLDIAPRITGQHVPTAKDS